VFAGGLSSPAIDQLVFAVGEFSATPILLSLFFFAQLRKGEFQLTPPTPLLSVFRRFVLPVRFSWACFLLMARGGPPMGLFCIVF